MKLKGGGQFDWSFEMDKNLNSMVGPVKMTMTTDKIFIPAKLDKSNFDTRELSFLLKSMEQVAGYSSKSKMAKAVKYFLKNYVNLTLFLDNVLTPDR